MSLRFRGPAVGVSATESFSRMRASNGSTRVEKILLLVPRWLVTADALRCTGNLLAHSYDPLSLRIYDPLTQVFTRCDRRSSPRAARILDSFRKVYQALSARAAAFHQKLRLARDGCGEFLGIAAGDQFGADVSGRGVGADAGGWGGLGGVGRRAGCGRQFVRVGDVRAGGRGLAGSGGHGDGERGRPVCGMAFGGGGPGAGSGRSGPRSGVGL